jgi:hypothetical protein
LQNDASGLQRVLQDAGLKTANNGMQFSLRDQSGQQQQQQQQMSASARQPTESAAATIELQPAVLTRYIARAGGIDIRV